MAKLRSNSGQTAAKWWSNSGQTAVKQWSNCGQMVVKLRSDGFSLRTQLVRWWFSSGQVVVEWWSARFHPPHAPFAPFAIHQHPPRAVYQHPNTKYQHPRYMFAIPPPHNAASDYTVNLHLLGKPNFRLFFFFRFLPAFDAPDSSWV